MTEPNIESPVADYCQLLGKIYPDNAVPGPVHNARGPRTHIATIEAKPHHPAAMDAALVETAALTSQMSLQLQNHFEEQCSRYDGTEDPDWALTRAALNRILQSGHYLRVAESHAVAMGAADRGPLPEDGTSEHAARTLRCRLILTTAAWNALSSMRNDVCHLVSSTAFAISGASSNSSPDGPYKHGPAALSADAAAQAGHETLDVPLRKLLQERSRLERLIQRARSQDGTPQT